MKKEKEKNAIIIYLILIIIANITVLLLSTVTSPLIKYLNGYNDSFVDSEIFYIIGKAWIKDKKIPGINLFDHKGPFIFLINGLGYLLTKNITGICFIEIISLCIVTIIIYKTYRLKYNQKIALLFSFVNFIIYPFIWNYGNMVTEYTMPFIIISIYGFIKWIYRNKNIKHSPLCALFYGITIGICIMSRASDALILCLCIIYITINLIIYKEWKNLLYNILCFLCGLSLIILPFCIYYTLNNGLYELWYSTIFANLIYIQNTNFYKDNVNIFLICIFTLPCIINNLIILIHKIIKKDENIFIQLFFIITAIIMMIAYLKSLQFLQYLYVNIPLLLFSFMPLGDNCINTTKHINIIKIIVLEIILIICCLYSNYIVRKNNIQQQFSMYVSNTILTDLNEYLNNDTFLFCNSSEVISLYPQLNKTPDIKYWTIQSWMVSFKTIEYEDILNEIKNNPPMYILFGEYSYKNIDNEFYNKLINDISYIYDKTDYTKNFLYTSTNNDPNDKIECNFILYKYKN